MAALETKKIIQKFIGLESFGTDRQRRYLKIMVPICASILMVLFLLSMTLGLFLNKNENFGKTSIKVSSVFGLLIVITIYWHLLINYERINLLLDDMRDVVNDNCK